MRRVRDAIAVAGFLIAAFGTAWDHNWMGLAWVIFAAFWFGMYRTEEGRQRMPVKYTIHLDPHGQLVDLDKLAKRIATIQHKGFRADSTRGPR